MQYTNYVLPYDSAMISNIVNKIKMQPINEVMPDGLLQIFLRSPFCFLVVPAESTNDLPGGREVQESVWKEVKSRTKLAWGYMDEHRNAIICLVCPSNYISDAKVKKDHSGYTAYAPENRPAVIALNQIFEDAITVFQKKRTALGHKNDKPTAPAKPGIHVKAEDKNNETIKAKEKNGKEERTL